MLVVEDESSRQLVRGRRLVSTLLFGYVYAFISHAVVKKKKDHKKKKLGFVQVHAKKIRRNVPPKKGFIILGVELGKKRRLVGLVVQREMGYLEELSLID